MTNSLGYINKLTLIEIQPVLQTEMSATLLAVNKLTNLSAFSPVKI